MPPASAIDSLLQEIQDLQNARKLLEKVWLEIGPYRDKPIPDAVWFEIQRYFKFDDSE